MQRIFLGVFGLGQRGSQGWPDDQYFPIEYHLQKTVAWVRSKHPSGLVALDRRVCVENFRIIGIRVYTQYNPPLVINVRVFQLEMVSFCSLDGVKADAIILVVFVEESYATETQMVTRSAATGIVPGPVGRKHNQF